MLTTPEQLALLISAPDADSFFSDLRYVIFDELHSLVASKRGHLLALGLARLRRLRPAIQTIGLSATVTDPDELREWLVAQGPNAHPMADLIVVDGGAKPEITILKSRERVPWQGHMARYAMPEIYEAIKAHKTTLLFVNTRSPGRAPVPGTLAHQRGDAADRAPPRLARRQPTPPRGSGDGGQRVARRRRHLDARPRHRLGRRRSRGACRRAEGGLAPRPADRARQPPDGRALARHPRAGQPVRGDGVPGGARRQLSGEPGLAADARGLPRRPCPARPRHGLRRALPLGRPLRRGRHRLTLSQPRSRDLRPRRRFRRDRRLLAARLRPLRQDPADGGRHVARDAPVRRSGLPDERRHDHRIRSPPRAPHPRQDEERHGARRAGARQDRGELPRDPGHRRHVPLLGPSAEVRGHPRDGMPRHQDARRRGQGPLLWRPEVPAHHLPRRQGPRDAGRPRTMGRPALSGRRMAGDPEAEIRHPRPERSPDRDLSERQPLLHGGLSVRGPPRAPDARHAAHAPPGARARQAPRASSPRTTPFPSGAAPTWAR